MEAFALVLACFGGVVLLVAFSRWLAGRRWASFGHIALATAALTAAAILLPVARLRGLGFPKGVVGWLPFLAVALFNNVVPFCLIVIGQTFITSGLAAVLNATTPLFVILRYGDRKASITLATGVEARLIQADVGVETTQYLVNRTKDRCNRNGERQDGYRRRVVHPPGAQQPDPGGRVGGGVRGRGAQCAAARACAVRARTGRRADRTAYGRGLGGAGRALGRGCGS